MIITQRFGLNVRYFRKLGGLSQEELSALCELHRTYIGSVERGERNVTLLSAEKIAHALKVSIIELLQEIKLDD